MKPLRGLVLAKYGPQAASTRQRFLQFQPALQRAGVELDVHPLLGDDYLAGLFSGGRISKTAIAKSYLARLRLLLAKPDVDFIWVQYECFPYLPSVFENLVFRTGKPVVLDYDDAIFLNYAAHKSRLLRQLLSGKIGRLQARADLTLCGNTFLRDNADSHGANTAYIPTCLDTTVFKPADSPPNGHPVIGWIGAPSTYPYVGNRFLGMFDDLIAHHDARVTIVGAHGHEEPRAGFDFVPWAKATEVASIQSMSIGIMPLTDDPWARGKCGYKLIQYMACGLPVIASPVGVNADIVEHGVNGFLAQTDADWRTAFETLLSDADLRAEMGAAGRAKAVAEFATTAHAPRLIKFLTDIATT